LIGILSHPHPNRYFWAHLITSLICLKSLHCSIWPEWALAIACTYSQQMCGV